MDKQIEKFEFRVIDNNTGEEADIEEIALKEDWAAGLIYCDMEGFAILEDGSLVLLDECGDCAYCPSGRFSIIPEGAVVLTREEYENLNLKLFEYEVSISRDYVQQDIFDEVFDEKIDTEIENYFLHDKVKALEELVGALKRHIEAYKEQVEALKKFNDVSCKKTRKETAEKYHTKVNEAIDSVPNATKEFVEAWKEKNDEIFKEFK